MICDKSTFLEQDMHFIKRKYDLKLQSLGVKDDQSNEKERDYMAKRRAHVT
jgi:hypothetical protein